MGRTSSPIRPTSVTGNAPFPVPRRRTLDESLMSSGPVIPPLSLMSDGYDDVLLRNNPFDDDDDDDEIERRDPLWSSNPETRRHKPVNYLSRANSVPNVASPKEIEQMLLDRPTVKPAFKPTFVSSKPPVAPPIDRSSAPTSQATTMKLPTTSSLHNFSPEIRLISPATLHDVVTGKYADVLDHIVIDCRFPYEFNGGHVRNAKNLWTVENIMGAFFTHPVLPLHATRTTALIFHCEFSSHRAPTQYMNVKSIDRELTEKSQHGLLYPEVYVVEGGYEAIFNAHPTICEPQSYLPMKDPNFEKDMDQFETMLDRSRLVTKSRSWKDGEFMKLHRAYSEGGVSSMAAVVQNQRAPLSPMKTNAPQTPLQQIQKPLRSSRQSLGELLQAEFADKRQ